LQPDDQIVPAGRSIGLMIFSSDRDFTLWPQPGTELTVDLDGTTLQLPVVGGASSFQVEYITGVCPCEETVGCGWGRRRNWRVRR